MDLPVQAFAQIYMARVKIDDQTIQDADVVLKGSEWYWLHYLFNNQPQIRSELL
jgi:hypothetical protein